MLGGLFSLQCSPLDSSLTEWPHVLGRELGKVSLMKEQVLCLPGMTFYHTSGLN